MDERIKVKLIGIRKETADVKTYRFEPLDKKKIEFLPGQFIFLFVKIQKQDALIEVRRSYSIASSPSDESFLELTVKKVENGLVSTHFDENVKINDIFEISSPMGKFNYTDDIKKVALIAAGSGVVPMRSIIRYCTEKKLDTNIDLIYSVKTSHDIIYKKEIMELAGQNKNLKYFVTATRDDAWDGHRGRIDENMIKDTIKDIGDTVFYLCGPLEFIRSVASILSSLGVDRANIKRDVWA